MEQLPSSQYNLVLPALATVTSNCLYARSVIENHVKGCVYVDSVKSPKGFYIIHPYGMSLLLGEISNEFLSRDIGPYMTERGVTEHTGEFLQLFPEHLEKEVDRVLSKNLAIFNGPERKENNCCTVTKHRRINFRFNPEKFNRFAHTLDLSRYLFREVDEPTFQTFSGSVVPSNFWDCYLDFNEKGTGYSLQQNNKPAAVAFSSFAHGNVLELGMETDIQHRGKGLATAVCAKLILHCLRESLTPAWACRADNYGSHRLAIKLGFEPIESLPYYILGKNKAERVQQKQRGNSIFAATTGERVYL